MPNYEVLVEVGISYSKQRLPQLGNATDHRKCGHLYNVFAVSLDASPQTNALLGKHVIYMFPKLSPVISGVVMLSKGTNTHKRQHMSGRRDGGVASRRRCPHSARAASPVTSRHSMLNNFVLEVNKPARLLPGAVDVPHAQKLNFNRTKYVCIRRYTAGNTTLA